MCFPFSGLCFDTGSETNTSNFRPITLAPIGNLRATIFNKLMPKMRAAQIARPGWPFEIVERPILQPDADWVLNHLPRRRRNHTELEADTVPVSFELSHANFVAQNREWRYRGGRQRCGILWKTISARGNREERCRIHSLPAERRRLPFSFAHSARAFHAHKTRNAELDALVLDRHQRRIDSKRSSSTLPNRTGRSFDQNVFVRRRHSARSVCRDGHDSYRGAKCRAQQH